MTVSLRAKPFGPHLVIAYAAVTVVASAQQPPGLRLPGIIQKWTPDSETGRPDISIEEIGRCMGVDLSLHSETLQ